MRLRPLAAIAAGLSLYACTFDGTGLTGNTAVTNPSADDSTTDGSTSEAPTTGPVDPTAGQVCGNFQTEGDEECDNGESNNGTGGVCRSDCKLNVCGDEYVATFMEGCDDGNTADGDGCSATCELEGCGDGVKGGVEECDDGNSTNDDNCTNLCRLPQCGDGVKNGTEECDDENGLSEVGACVPGCKNAVCGDGFVQEGVEACDDMNAVDDDGCSNACVSASCGDGVVQAGEGCDDMNDVNEDACLNTCAVAACGDSVVQTDVEECDDGNTMSGDMCSATCKNEICGNNVVDPGEMCDDGNKDDDDACLSTCVPAECGDGFVQAGVEECDDDNDIETDACLSTCKSAKCGDMQIREGVEDCEDGNTSETDVCNNMCKRVAFWVFVTSEKFSGNEVVDLATADAKCNALAAGKPIAGTYKAWLGDANESAASRLHPSSVKYITTIKGLVANNWADLTDGTLAVPITRDENGQSAVPNPAPMNCDSGSAPSAAVWTGATPDGENAGIADCMGWSSGAMAETGNGGLLNKVNSPDWSGCTFTCDVEARLYCIEQPPA